MQLGCVGAGVSTPADRTHPSIARSRTDTTGGGGSAGLRGSGQVWVLSRGLGLSEPLAAQVSHQIEGALDFPVPFNMMTLTHQPREEPRDQLARGPSALPGRGEGRRP